MHTLRSRKLIFEGSSANLECFDLPLPFYKVPSTTCATRRGLPASMYFCLWFPYHLYPLSRSSHAISYSESSPNPGKHLLGQDVTNLAVLPPPTVFREPLTFFGSICRNHSRLCGSPFLGPILKHLIQTSVCKSSFVTGGVLILKKLCLQMLG